MFLLIHVCCYVVSHYISKVQLIYSFEKKKVACIYIEFSLQIGVSVSKGKFAIYLLKTFFNLQFHHQYRLTPISLSNEIGVYSLNRVSFSIY